jgi:hypothetical protein
MTDGEKRNDGLLSPCPQDRAQAIIALNELIHERSGYAVMSTETRGMSRLSAVTGCRHSVETQRLLLC